MENSWSPRDNTFLWYVITLPCTLIMFNFMNFIWSNFFLIFWPSLYILKIICIKIIPSLAGLQTKGNFSCPVCGPKIKYHHSRGLGKEVFDEYRHFLSKNQRYPTPKKDLFNEKEETGVRQQRMKTCVWNLQYNSLSRYGSNCLCINIHDMFGLFYLFMEFYSLY